MAVSINLSNSQSRFTTSQEEGVCVESVEGEEVGGGSVESVEGEEVGEEE